MSNLVHNERLKYLATFCNNIGLAFLIAGGLNATANVPVATIELTVWKLLAIGILGCVVGVCLSQLLLGLLKE
jgi:hypothetical protein